MSEKESHDCPLEAVLRQYRGADEANDGVPLTSIDWSFTDGSGSGATTRGHVSDVLREHDPNPMPIVDANDDLADK